MFFKYKDFYTRQRRDFSPTPPVFCRPALSRRDDILKTSADETHAAFFFNVTQTTTVRTESERERENCTFRVDFHILYFNLKPGGKRPERQRRVRREDYSFYIVIINIQGQWMVCGKKRNILYSLNISVFSVLCSSLRYATARLGYYFEKKEEYFGLPV